MIQAFAKPSPLHAPASAQSKPPFLIAQIMVLPIFIGLGPASLRKFHPAVA